MALDIANTVLNASPYFDDFTENKNFHRILFRPSVAVQARELNQIQSIFQNQIERFGQHLFKDGTVIKGCGLTYITDIEYVSIADQFENNVALSSTNTSFVNAIAIGNTSGVVAQIIAAREGFAATSKPARFFIRYTQPGTSGDRVFQENEYLRIYQPGKSYVDKIVVQVTTAVTVNSQNFPVGSRLINNTTKARGFIANAYANGTGSFIELRNIRKTFAEGDVVTVSTDSNITATIENVDKVFFANTFIDSVRVIPSNTGVYTSRGFAYGVTCSPGIIFHKGHFIRVDNHTTIVNEETKNPAGKVLIFNTSEEIIRETQDSSLYDNALGTPNINAPGAHRLKLTSTLIAKNKTDISNTDIAFPIVEFGNSGPVFQRTETQYNIIGEELAKRTYEESGHYIVKPFNVSTKPDSANTYGTIYEITQGLAYVKGKRVELINNLNVSGRRGSDTNTVNESITTISYGSFIVTKEVRGYFPIDQSFEVRLFDTAQSAITGDIIPGAAASGNIIGYANIRAFNYVQDSGYKGDPATQFRMYLFNVRMLDAKKFEDVRSVSYYNGSTYEAYADLVLENSKAVIKDATLTPLVFGLNGKAIKSLVDQNDNYDTNYYYTGANTSALLLADGTIQFSVGANKGQVGYGDSTSATEYRLDVIAAANAVTENLTGTASCNTTGFVTGSGTSFDTDFLPGDYIQFVTAGSYHRVTSVTSSTAMTVANGATVSSNTFKRAHKEGSYIPLDSATRTVTIVTGGESAEIDLGKNYTTVTNVFVRYYAYNNESNELKKELNRRCMVIIRTANNVGGGTGPWSLGVPDVFRLTGVYFGTNTSNFTTAINRVSDFILDTGQRDTHYDHGTIKTSPRSSLGSLANTFMLVEFDCFTVNTSVGEGFFSIDSYPINDDITADLDESIRTWEIPSYLSTGTGLLYDLRDSIDFRPYKANTANVTQSYTSATVNPAATNNFNTTTTNYNPYPGTDLTANFTYYLGRKDRVVLTADGLFRVDEGLPALTPKYPQVDPDVLIIAEVDIPPYPSLTDVERLVVSKDDYAIKLNLLSHKRFTMKDISVLEQRIQRLEYYTTLNLLEKVALQTTIADDNGEARFQNGFFVDPFNSHIYGRTSDPSYRAAIDERNSYMRPAFHPENIEMEFDTNTAASGNVVLTGGIVTLDYDEEILVDQPFASDLLNVSGSPLRWSGTIDLRPSRTADVELLAQPAVVAGTSRVIQAYAGMTAVTPGTANYGWWRENTITSDDYEIVAANKEEIREQTSVPMETNKSVQVTEGKTMTSGIQFLCKERVFAFRAVGLKPNLDHYLFINNINNSALAALGEIANTESRDESYVERTGYWGSPLTSDSRGELVGKFIIPALALKTGTHKLTLRNRDTVTTGIDESLAECYFTIDVSTIDPPVIINPSTLMIPPDDRIGTTTQLPSNYGLIRGAGGNIEPIPVGEEAPVSDFAPNPTGEAGSIVVSNNTSNGTITNATEPNDVRVIALPEIFARFTVSGNTIITSEINANNEIDEGVFSLTFTDDSYVKNATIATYEWDFGYSQDLIKPSSNTASGIGPHTINYTLYNSIDDVKVTLTITDTEGRKSTYSKLIRLQKLLKAIVIEEPPPAVNTVPVSAGLYIYPSIYNQLSDLRLYRQWNKQAFNPAVTAVLRLPNLLFSYNGVAGLGANNVLKLVAKPTYNYAANVVWSKTLLTGAALPNVTYANVGAIYATSGGTGYSNSDTINLSNGQVEAFATLITNGTGAIQSVTVTAMGNFTDGTAATTSTFTANSTVNSVFTLSQTSTNTSILVTINGLVQRPGSDYTASGTTLTLSSNAADGAIVYVQYTDPLVPGTGIKPTNQIRIRVNSNTQPANSSNGNTSGGSGATFELIMGETSNSVLSSPQLTNDVLTLFPNTTFGATTRVRVSAELFLSNGYANSVGNSSLIVHIINSNNAVNMTKGRWADSSTWNKITSAADQTSLGVHAFTTSDGGGSSDSRISTGSTYKQQYIKIDT